MAFQPVCSNCILFDGEAMVLTACDHVLHRKCFAKMNKKICSVCNLSIDISDLRKLDITKNPVEIKTQCSKKYRDMKKKIAFYKFKNDILQNDRDEVMKKWRNEAMNAKKQVEECKKVYNLVQEKLQLQYANLNTIYVHKTIAFDLLCELYTKETKNSIPSNLHVLWNDDAHYDTTWETYNSEIKNILMRASQEIRNKINNPISCSIYANDTVADAFNCAAENAVLNQMQSNISTANDQTINWTPSPIPEEILHELVSSDDNDQADQSTSESD
ncbi:unnamed protein product [Chironomus riparius]|uniref:RING-type domain-containing protein n=1 Tax=Chironomus riparius TaxID=315576 RepID=A0A9N9S8H3_9DIPT|nr:unnamed protein product [Chironomus riparius]